MSRRRRGQSAFSADADWRLAWCEAFAEWGMGSAHAGQPAVRVWNPLARTGAKLASGVGRLLVWRPARAAGGRRPRQQRRRALLDYQVAWPHAQPNRIRTTAPAPVDARRALLVPTYRPTPSRLCSATPCPVCPWPRTANAGALKKASLHRGSHQNACALTPCSVHSTSDDTYWPQVPPLLSSLLRRTPSLPCVLGTPLIFATERSWPLRQPCFASLPLRQRVSLRVVCDEGFCQNTLL